MAKSILTDFQKKFLIEVKKNNFLTKYFYLTGGTALAEFYLQHRLSEDLDFFSEKEVNIQQIRSFIKQISNPLKITKIEYRNYLGLHTFLLYANKELLKVDFSYYPFTRFEENNIIDGLQIDSIKDIAVNKIQTITTSPRSRDFIDLFLIIQKTNWSIEALMKDSRNKFDWYTDLYHVGSRFLLAKEIKDYPTMLIKFDNNKMIDFWLKEAKKLKKEIIK